jgi:hypothetical protein
MNKIPSLLFLLATVFFLSCSNDTNTTTAAATTSETSNEPKQTTSSETTQSDGIVGEWEMEGSVLDTNDNLQIDEEERKNTVASKKSNECILFIVKFFLNWYYHSVQPSYIFQQRSLKMDNYNLKFYPE